MSRSSQPIFLISSLRDTLQIPTMKWYAKQLKELRKKEEAVAPADTEKSYPSSKLSLDRNNLKPFKKTPNHKSVFQRNVNRPKTDSK